MVNNKLGNVQGRGPDLIQGIIPTFVWRNWGKPQKISQDSQYPGQIWRWHIPNTSQDC